MLVRVCYQEVHDIIVVRVRTQLLFRLREIGIRHVLHGGFPE